MLNWQIQWRNGEQKLEDFSRTLNSHVSVLRMGFMYILALNWKNILVMRRDIAYQIWDLLDLTNVSFMPLLLHQVAHMMPDFYANIFI